MSTAEASPGPRREREREATLSLPDRSAPALQVRNVSKRFGHTVAAHEVTFSLQRGEMLALAGHNGAGKSTIAKIIGGIHALDAGTIEVDGVALPPHHSVPAARDAGVALAFQEITLFPDLRVFEHVGAMHPERVRRNWRGQACDEVEARLDEIFPSHGTSAHARVESLSLAQRQMVQVVLATMHQQAPSVLVLDEPTSALTDDLTSELFAYLDAARAQLGLAVILVSHKTADILHHTDRTIVMRDGAVVSDRPTSELTVAQLMVDMGAAPDTETERETGPTRSRSVDTGGPMLEIHNLRWRGLDDVSLEVNAGEIVGLAGLEANGQRELLEAVWRSRHRIPPPGVRRAVSLDGAVAFVSGDRQVEGLFSLWDVERNITVGSLDDVSTLGLVRPREERAAANRWIERYAIKAEPDDPIGSLSGGNQQKVLLARGVGQGPDLLVLDDPFRGVDITAKAEAYRQLRELADAGTAILWYTSENRELLECDRVYVMRQGACSAELRGDQLSNERIILASFGAADDGAPQA